MARNDELAAVKAASAMLAEEEASTEAATEGAEEATSQGAEEETVEEPLFPSWEIPEDFVEDLDEDEDLSPEAIRNELEQTEEYQELDEEGRRLLARARAAEKRAEHYEKLRLQEARKNWAEEAKKHLPYATPFLDTIQADSRKSFIRQAKALHEKNAAFFKPYAERMEAATKKTETAEKEQKREQEKKEWGSSATQEAPTRARLDHETLARNRAKGDLTSTIKAMIFSPPQED